MKWPEIAIKKLCLPTRQIDPREKPNEVFNYVDISSVDREQKTISQTVQIVGSEAPSRARKEIKTGDILVSTVRPNLNAVAIVPPELDGQIASTGFCVLSPNGNNLIGKYLFYYTRTPNFIETLTSKVRGAHYPAVSDSDVKDLELSLLPLSEQRRIVEILDQADALRKKRAEADAKAERILTALFYKMFGESLALVNNKDAIKLEDCKVDFQNGFACGDKDSPNGVPHLRMNNIDDKGILNLELIRTVPPEYDREKYRLQEGDVLFMSTNSEDKVGKTCVFYPPFNANFLFSNHLTRIRINKPRLPPEYVATYLHQLWRRGFYQGIAKRWVNQASISQQALGSINIAMPPKEDLQVFTSLMKECLKLRIVFNKSHEQLENLCKVLIHRAFTGNLTVKWRESHMKELITEMDLQAKALNLEVPA